MIAVVRDKARTAALAGLRALACAVEDRFRQAIIFAYDLARRPA